ncbi:hypothetical protein [Aliagarivorans marinus]|uniref:hypothetical protein n=1 Tax=Aliagarivorans marinus TaxID=561965 RepID=UPI00040C624E|nr:hypothetical protein [Aliagarivorans marinus]
MLDNKILDTKHAPVSQGIDQLAHTLREQGVKAGRTEARKMIIDAQTQSDSVIADARKRAGQIISEANKEAEFISNAGKQALHLAERNALLSMKSYLQERFAEQLHSCVEQAMSDPELLSKMILEVAGQNAIAEGEQVEVLLPAQPLSKQQLAESAEDCELNAFVKARTKEMLNQGVSIQVGEQGSQDLLFRIQDKDIEVNLGTESVSQMLLSHLQPRFRALLEGVVK